MDELRDVGLPVPLGHRTPPGSDPESRALAAAAADGTPLAPRVWIPAAAEAAFYRLNHLEGRLDALFSGVASDDPDEDEIEEIAPDARRLIAGHVLLDAWVDAFYDACRSLGPTLRVRRPGSAGRVATAGRPALLAVRAIWAERWEDDAIIARLRAGGGVRPEPAPVVVHAADAPAQPGAVIAAPGTGPSAAATFLAPDGRLTRLLPAKNVPEG